MRSTRWRCYKWCEEVGVSCVAESRRYERIGCMVRRGEGLRVCVWVGG